MVLAQSVLTKPEPADPPAADPPVVDLSSLPDEVEPLPDAMIQDPVVTEAKTILETRYHHDSTVYASGNTAVCYNHETLTDRVLPDCFVAFDVDAPSINAEKGYLIWEVGKPPDFVLEIASPTTARRDKTYKRWLYAELGIAEYWLFDLTGGDYYGAALIGGRLADGDYAPIRLYVNEDGLLAGDSAVLGLSLCVDGERLRFHDPATDSYLRSMLETEEARLEEQAGRKAAEAEVKVERAGRLRERSEKYEERAARHAAEDAAEAERAARQAAEARIRELEERMRRDQA